MTAPATLSIGSDSELLTQKKDLLGFGHAGARLAWILAHARTPLVVGVGGEWGSGRSSLLHMALESLASQKVLVKRLDAWVFRHESQLGLPLIGSLLAGLAGEGGRENELKNRMYPSLLIPGGFEALWGQISISDLEKLVERADRDMVRHAEILGEPQAFRQDFEELVELALKPSGSHRLIVVVENLDRCPAEGVLDFLERLTLFFKGGKAVFAMPLREAALLGELQRRFSLGSRLQASSCLDGLVDLLYPVPVPRPQEAAKYIVARLKEFLGNSESAQGVSQEKWDLGLFLRAPENVNLRRLNRTARTLATLFLLYPPLLEEGPLNFLLMYLRLYYPEAWRALESHGPGLAVALAQSSAEACAAAGTTFSEENLRAAAQRYGERLSSLGKERGLVHLMGNLVVEFQRANKALPEVLAERMAALERAFSLA